MRCRRNFVRPTGAFRKCGPPKLLWIFPLTALVLPDKTAWSIRLWACRWHMTADKRFARWGRSLFPKLRWCVSFCRHRKSRGIASWRFLSSGFSVYGHPRCPWFGNRCRRQLRPNRLTGGDGIVRRCRRPAVIPSLGRYAGSLVSRRWKIPIFLFWSIVWRSRDIWLSRPMSNRWGRPSGSPTLKLMGEQPESICITLEVCKVLPMIFVFQFLFYYLSVSLGKISCDSSFARMPERRISQVVGQTCRRGDGSQVVEFVTPRFVFVFFAEHGRHVVSQWASYAWYFEAVGQSVMGRRCYPVEEIPVFCSVIDETGPRKPIGHNRVENRCEYDVCRHGYCSIPNRLEVISFSQCICAVFSWVCAFIRVLSSIFAKIAKVG